MKKEEKNTAPETALDPAQEYKEQLDAVRQAIETLRAHTSGMVLLGNMKLGQDEDEESTHNATIIVCDGPMKELGVGLVNTLSDEEKTGEGLRPGNENRKQLKNIRKLLKQVLHGAEMKMRLSELLNLTNVQEDKADE